MKNLIKASINFIFQLFPLKNIILFESSPDFSDSSKALYDYLIEKGFQKKYQMVWLYNTPIKSFKDQEKNTEFLYRYTKNIFEKVRLTFYENTARFIFDSNSYIYKKRNNQIRIYLGHGMPIKLPTVYFSKLGDCDYILTTSPFFDSIYKDLLHVKTEKLLNIGLPRNDILKNKPLETKTSKSIFWMPTYRQHRTNKEDFNKESYYPYGLPCLKTEADLEKLTELLKEKNITLFLRLHPAQNPSFLKLDKEVPIILVDDQYLNDKSMELYEFLAQMDALITDYSSVYYDYLLTEKMIGLTIDDIALYAQNYSLAFDDYKKYIKGEYINNYEDLSCFIINVAQDVDKSKADRILVKEKYHQYLKQESSCQQLLELLIENHEF